MAASIAQAEVVTVDTAASTVKLKEAVIKSNKVITPVAIKNKFGGFSGEANPFKHSRKGVMNQRQLRKHLRSNPHQRKKYGK